MFLLFQAKPEIKGNTYSQIVLLFYIPFFILSNNSHKFPLSLKTFIYDSLFTYTPSSVITFSNAFLFTGF